MPWTDWIPGPDWQTNEGILRLGSLQQRWTGSPDGWIGMAMSAVLASFFIVSLAYMIAHGLNHANLRRWAKSEFYQVLANAILVLGLIVLVEVAVSGMSQVTADIATATGSLQYSGTGQAVDNPFYLAALFLDESLTCLKRWFVSAYIADTWIELVAEASIGEAGMDIINLSVVLAPIVGALYLIAHNVTFLLLATYFQLHFLVFIFQTMFTVFLPIGIILRTLPVSRGFGGFVIAVAIGLYVVYPISYSVLMLTTRSMESGGCEMSLSAAEMRGVSIGNPASFFYHKSTADRLRPEIERGIGMFGNQFMFFVYRGFIFPLVALSLTFTFVRASAAFFGADIAEMSRGLIKLI